MENRGRGPAVAELWRYPVKGIRGERLGRALLTEGGVEGDRVVRIVNGRKRVSARTVPRLLGLEGTLGEDGQPRIDGARWDEPAALEAVQQLAGVGAELIRDESLDRFDAAPILLTTDGAIEALGEDRRRFRPNLVVSGVEGLTERRWVGRTLRIGGAELQVVKGCERCLVTTIHPDTLEIEPAILTRIHRELDSLMGIYCEVTVGGEVAEGDAVEVS
jgi:uncharacterized protein YcbX